MKQPTLAGLAAGLAVAAAALIPALSPKAPAIERTQSQFQRPLTFEPNLGQLDPSVSFLAQGGGFGLWITGDSATFGLPGERNERIRMKWAGGNARAIARGLDPTESVSNYYIGNDQAKWRTKVPNYAKVRLADIYPGIALVFYPTADRQLEYDFEVAPGADPSAISLEFDGASGVKIESNGDLRIETPGGDAVTKRKPVAYQGEGRRRQEIAAAYELDGGGGGGDHKVRIKVARFDRTQRLIIDPVLDFSTYLHPTAGFSHVDLEALDTDKSGNIYVAGGTQGGNLPLATNSSGGVTDGFVSKFSQTGSLLYSTYMGGSGSEGIEKLAVGSAVYVTGWNFSSDFPFSSPFCGPGNQGNNSFRAKLNLSSGAVEYSCGANGGAGAYTHDRDVAVGGGGGVTYWLSNNCVDKGPLGATVTLQCFPGKNLKRIAADPTGGVWVMGQTSDPFALNKGQQVFLRKLEVNPITIYWGGSGREDAWDVAVDATGRVFVAGNTNSTDLPVTEGGGYNGGGVDGFVARINPLAAHAPTTVWARYVGSSGLELALSLALPQYDPTQPNRVYVAGETTSASFPAANAAWLPACVNGKQSPFIWSPGWSGCLGGSAFDSVAGVAARGGRVYVAGGTQSNNFAPIWNAFQWTYLSFLDGWLTVLSE